MKTTPKSLIGASLTLAAMAASAATWTSTQGHDEYTQKPYIQVTAKTDSHDLIMSLVCNTDGVMLTVSTMDIDFYRPVMSWRVDLLTGGRVHNLDALGPHSLAGVALNWPQIDGVQDMIKGLKAGKLAELELQDSQYNRYHYTLDLNGSQAALTALDKCKYKP